MVDWNLIKQELKFRGQTLEWLANELDVSYQSLRGWKWKKQNPPVEVLLGIGAVLGLTVEEIMGENHSYTPLPFSYRLKVSMERRGLSVQELSNRSTVPKIIILRLLSKADISKSANDIALLAKTLMVSADYLLGLDMGAEAPPIKGLSPITQEFITVARECPEEELEKLLPTLKFIAEKWKKLS